MKLPPGMRRFAIVDLGGIKVGRDTYPGWTHEELESAFVTEWNRVLEPILGIEWWTPKTYTIVGERLVQ